MAITEIFSKKQKELRGEIPEIYDYENILSALRVQIIYIIQDAFGKDQYSYNHEVRDAYQFVYETLCREYGKFSLVDGYKDMPEESLIKFYPFALVRIPPSSSPSLETAVWSPTNGNNL